MQQTFHLTPMNLYDSVEQIKFLRSITGWGLKESKDIVDDLSVVTLVARIGTVGDEVIHVDVGQESFPSVADFIHVANEFGFYVEFESEREESDVSPKEEPAPKKHDSLDLFAHNYSQLSDAITTAGGAFTTIREATVDEFIRICAMNGVELTAKSIR